MPTIFVIVAGAAVVMMVGGIIIAPIAISSTIRERMNRNEDMNRRRIVQDMQIAQQIQNNMNMWGAMMMRSQGGMQNAPFTNATPTQQPEEYVEYTTVGAKIPNQDFYLDQHNLLMEQHQTQLPLLNNSAASSTKPTVKHNGVLVGLLCGLGLFVALVFILAIIALV
jgi:hypothetical protein